MADEEEKKLKREELMQKNVAYYSVMFSAFVESRNEVDRQILTLSVACIGGLLAFQEKLIKTTTGLWLTIIVLVAFVVTIGIVLLIFDKNSEYIKNELREDRVSAVKLSSDLKKLDRYAFWSFIGSIVLSSILIIFGFFNTKTKENLNETQVILEDSLGQNNNKHTTNQGQSQQRPKEPTHKNSLSDAHLVKPSDKPSTPAVPTSEGGDKTGGKKPD